MFFLRQAQQRHADQGSVLEVNRQFYLRQDLVSQFGFPLRFRKLAQIDELQRLRIRRFDHLHGPAVDFRSGPDFCDRWRAHPGVVPMVLARGVSDMRVERVDSDQDEWVAWGRWGGLQRLRLSLTWASDSTDGPDEASVSVNTVMFPHATSGENDRTREASEKLPAGAFAVTAVDRSRQH